MTTLSRPRDGIPEVLATVASFHDAARALARGRGPFAVDTERASSYRYDDRAFLIQVRREDAGTFLFAPEGLRTEFSQILAPVMCGQSWIMHAARSDFPALNALDLRPAQLFDTEIAGRLVGAERVNLGSMVETYLGIGLAKNHGAENWSRKNLPTSWLAYAALDVELLIELSEALTIQLVHTNKLWLADEEFQAVLDTSTSLGLEHRWENLKGLHTLKTRRELAASRALWIARDRLARVHDQAPTLLLHDKVIVAAAKKPPRSKSEFKALDGWKPRYSKNLATWLSALDKARTQPRSQWPKPLAVEENAPRSLSTWRKINPEAAATYERLRARLEATAATLDIKLDSLLEPRVLKNLVWAAVHEDRLGDPHSIAHYLSQQGARNWQIETTLPDISQALAH